MATQKRNKRGRGSGSNRSICWQEAGYGGEKDNPIIMRKVPIVDTNVADAVSNHNALAI